jgi:hypothetical protein
VFALYRPQAVTAAQWHTHYASCYALLATQWIVLELLCFCSCYSCHSLQLQLLLQLPLLQLLLLLLLLLLLRFLITAPHSNCCGRCYTAGNACNANTTLVLHHLLCCSDAAVCCVDSGSSVMPCAIQVHSSACASSCCRSSALHTTLKSLGRNTRICVQQVESTL